VTQTSLRRRALPVTFAAMTAGSMLLTAPALAATAKTTYKGSAAQMRWGTVQVSIVVKNKKITNVKATVDIHTDRSQFINDQALPLLKEEVLQAQSVAIDTVSGASDTSEAYIASLQSAVKKAIKVKKLTTKAL
jgi:uncharacterized protein with FMN-binding domain